MTNGSSRLRILVLGYLVRGPLGGLAWHHLQYMLGLSRLGHDVYFIEDSEDYPACYDPTRDALGTDPSYGLRFAASAFRTLDLDDRWAYYDAHQDEWRGPCANAAIDICAAADLLVNVSGVNPLRPWLAEVPRRAFIDTDPVFTQVRHLTDAEALRLASQHTGFFTFGENTGRNGCTTPEDGFAWQPTRQPVVLEAWSVTPGPKHGKFTTVMQWDSYGAREYGGHRYGMKSDSFAPYLDLPQKTHAALELAVGSDTAPRSLLHDRGWTVRDPREPTMDPWTYQSYIRRSKAEFSVAKQGYVACRSGWFSERSAAYLASGRPVVTQETGFSDWLPAGSGIVAFRSPGEALDAIEHVNAQYDTHCRASRAVAEEYFDSGKVLTHLVERAMS